ncbi:unnamed protein product [Diamesa serratosioi]
MEGTVVKNAEKLVKKSREEKLREGKIETDILKSLNGIEEIQKFQTLLKRCVEAERSNKSLLMSQKQTTKTIENVLHEKDNIQSDYNRMILTKSKLESLCRELQLQNKSIKEESFSKIKDEEERRKETQTKFQKSLNEIQKLMNENSEKNQKLELDNKEMSSKFKYILEQYEQRELQMDKVNKQMELITQLNEAKMEKSKIESLAEKENYMQQMIILEDTIKILKKQLIETAGSEKCLKAQVEMYASKYGEFTNVFEGYKTDMTKMSKKTLKQERELLMWKAKFEKSNALLLELVSEKQVRDEHIQKTAKQLFYLQKLCRTLSAEKKAFYNKLVEMNIEIPVVEDASKEIVPTFIDPDIKKSNEKSPEELDAMTKNCDELKKNLAQLQGQLSALAEEPIAKVAAKKADKTKAKKNKKASNKTPEIIENAEAQVLVNSNNETQEADVAVIETIATAPTKEVIDDVNQPELPKVQDVVAQ